MGVPVTGDEIDRVDDVVGRQRVAHRLLGRARQLMPGARALVQCAHGSLFGDGELAAQQLGE
jgi:hypothetical protein